jgi:large subunit ribosomal protein L5
MQKKEKLVDLKKRYQTEIAPELKAEHPEIKNAMQIPVLKKIVINMGIGEAVANSKLIEEHRAELAMISGQRPVVTKSKKSISNFKLREGQAIGLKVTLRGQKMYDFLERFCHIAAPRIRDFRGFERKCDGKGNYTFGLKDQQIFPEVDLTKSARAQGMDVTLVTSATSDALCVALLTRLGFPFKQVKTHG